jgi:hypothetical protein
MRANWLSGVEFTISEKEFYVSVAVITTIFIVGHFASVS